MAIVWPLCDHCVTVVRNSNPIVSSIWTCLDFGHPVLGHLLYLNSWVIKLDNLKTLLWPGPASTVEERSLRNIPSEGTVVRNSPWICLFRRDLFFSRKNVSHKCLADFLYRTSQSISQPRSRKAVEDNYYCMKGNVAWTNWPYDVILLSDVICILLR